MKTQFKNFWKKSHLTLGNSFASNSKEVKRRLQMSLKKKSSQFKITYGFLGLMVCVFVASAFKINIQTIPTLIEQGFTSTQKSFEQKVDKKIPSIKIKAESKIDTIDYIFITDLEGNKLNPHKAITQKSILVNMISDSQKIEVLEMLVTHSYSSKVQTETKIHKGVGISGNQVDVHRHFDTEHNGMLEIQILKIREDGKEKDILANPYTQTFKIQHNPKNDPPYKVYEDGGQMYLGLRSMVFMGIDKKYNQEKEHVRYELDNGTFEVQPSISLVKIKPEHLGNLEIKIYYKDKLLKSKTFEVIPLESPVIHLFDSASDIIELNETVESKYLEFLRVRVGLPFKKAIHPFPSELKYEAEAVELTQFREGTMISSQVFREKNKRGDIVFDMSKMDLKTGDSFRLKVINVNKISKITKISKEVMSNPNTQFTIVVPEFNKE